MDQFGQGGICALGGGTVVHAIRESVRVIRSGAEIERFEVGAPVGWLRVAPDGKSALIYDVRSTHVWRWLEGVGHYVLATATSSRDAFGCGFILAAGEPLTLLAKGGVLRAFTNDWHERFTTNLESPHAFDPHTFIQLPGERVGLAGFFFSDYANAVVTVQLNALMNDREAVQKAIEAKAPVWDRAPELTLGPCPPDMAVVFRNPEDTEIPEDEEDLEDLGDVGNFTGIYVRNLETGALIERYAYAGRTGRGAPIVGTGEWIAVEASGGVDLIRRSSGTLRKFRGVAALDTFSLQATRILEGGTAEIVPLTALV